MYAQIESRDGVGDVAILPVVDISAGGLFVALEEPSAQLVIGDLVSVFIEVPGEVLDVALNAKVVRICNTGDRRGVGMEWGMHTLEVADRFSRVLARLQRKGSKLAA